MSDIGHHSESRDLPARGDDFDVLTVGIAHDLSNIMSTIAGNAALAIEDLMPGNPARQSVYEIQRAVGRAREIVRRILALSGQDDVIGNVVQPGEPVESATTRVGPLHILYVDDDAALVTLITRQLNRCGYRVTGTTDPATAIATFEKSPNSFDVVVTDLSMPAMPGFELTRLIKAVRPCIPTFMTSGCVRPEDVERSSSSGIIKLIYKPDVVEELCKELHRLFPPQADTRTARCSNPGSNPAEV